MTPDSGVRTRAEDPADMEKRLMDVRREGRKRTIVMSVIASGLVCLFINHASDVSSDNRQADRNRLNCNNTQAVARRLASVSSDVSLSSKDPAIKIRWAGYAQDFKKGFPPGGLSCAELFPKHNVFYIF